MLNVLTASLGCGLLVSFVQATATAERVSRVETRIVRGHSLDGLARDGQSALIISGFYLDNVVQRRDLVAYRYAGHDTPLVKVVVGVPGDHFRLIPATTGGWSLWLNGELAQNSKHEPYALSDGAYRVLKLYEADFKGVIPPDAYLILGNLPGGSLDSSRFGLIHKSDIIGKVILQ